MCLRGTLDVIDTRNAGPEIVISDVTTIVDIQKQQSKQMPSKRYIQKLAITFDISGKKTQKRHPAKNRRAANYCSRLQAHTVCDALNC